MPFDRAREYLERFEKIKVSETMIRETVERCGKALVRHEDLAVKRAAVQLLPRNAPENKEEQVKNGNFYLQMDGAFIPIIDRANGGMRSYVENKLAVGFYEKDILRSGKQCVVSNKRFAISPLPGVSHFEMRVRKMAIDRNVRNASRVIVVSDGAVWIDKMRERQFPDSVHILDWYHAKEKLYETAHLLFKENQKAVYEWAKPLESLLWIGQARRVCSILMRQMKANENDRTKLAPLYKYYRRRISKMRYDEFRAAGFIIGSGAVESANKYLVAGRLKQSGMKWNLSGAHAILKLREKIFDETWDSTWRNRNTQFLYAV